MNIVEAARGWAGVPFHHQGRNRAGVDCLGLVLMASIDQDEVDITLEDLKGYAREPDGVTLKAECDRQLVKGDKNNLQDGDILMMKFRVEPQHLAIKTDTGIIHALKSSGKVVEHGLDDKWRKRILGVYRLE